MKRQYKSESWRKALEYAKDCIEHGRDYDTYIKHCYTFKRIPRSDYNYLRTIHLIGGTDG